MTIVVCIRVNDGIVLSSDSATSFVDTTTGIVHKIYNHADKVFNLIKGEKIGAMTCGSGSIGPASISALSKDLRVLFRDVTPHNKYHIDLTNYTIEEVATKARDFFFERFAEAHPVGVPNFAMGYRVAGYSYGAALPEAWEVGVRHNAPLGPTPLYDHADPQDFGPRWDGEREALDRLILGTGSRAAEALKDMGMDQAAADSVHMALMLRLKVSLYMAAMPIQDAIDLARFLCETACKFAYFNLRAPTVGGAVEIATITKHEGFKWVSRKHYFHSGLNPPP